MLKVKACAAAATTVLLVAFAAPAPAQTLCEPEGSAACAQVQLAGGLFGNYEPPRYYRGYRRPSYTPPPAFTYPYGDPVYPTYYEPELVRKIQSGLDYLGYNAGPVDGVFGDLTRQAITEFQDDAGLVVDGLPSENLYASMSRYLVSDYRTREPLVSDPPANPLAAEPSFEPPASGPPTSEPQAAEPQLR